MEEAIESVSFSGTMVLKSPTFEDIKKYYDENLHPDVIDLDDQEVYENIFCKRDKWMGIFQFTEKGSSSILPSERTAKKYH